MNIKIGDKAPDFTLNSTTGYEISLQDLLKEKKGDTLLIFFPLAFSNVCTEELCTIRDNMKFYISLNANVIAISVDSFYTLREFKKANNLNFTLLSDFNKNVSAQYGALYKNYFGMKGVSKRATFLIDSAGTIKHVEVLEDSDRLPDFKAIQKSMML